jgi:hypothetical protein
MIVDHDGLVKFRRTIGTLDRAVPFVLALALAASPGVADAFVGSGALAGTSRLVVRRCGTVRSALGLTVAVRSDGTWQSTDESGETFTGTSTPVGRSNRKLRLAFDGATTADLVASITEDVAILWFSAVTVTSVPKTFLLTLDRARHESEARAAYVFKAPPKVSAPRPTRCAAEAWTAQW